MSDSWYGVGRGLCLISIMLMKLDFNVHMVSACICKQCHSCGKELDHLLQNLQDFTDFYKRQLCCKREERATLFSVQRIAARNNQLLFNFAAPFTKKTKVEGRQSSWPQYIKIVNLFFCENFNGGTINIVTAFFQRGEAINHQTTRYNKDFPQPVGNKTETLLLLKNVISMAFCCSS